MIRKLVWIAAVTAYSALAGAAPDSRAAAAVESGDKPLLRSLIGQKADVNGVLTDGTTALHWAVDYDDAEAVGLLLKAGAKVDAADRYGMTPLFYAVTNGNADICGRLLAAGANANAGGQEGDTLLMIAARAGSVEILQELLEKGSSVNAADTTARQTPLMWAVRGNNLKAVKVLLDHGADVNARTREGARPARRPPARAADRTAPVSFAAVGRTGAIRAKRPAACRRCSTRRATVMRRSPRPCLTQKRMPIRRT